MGLYIQYIGRSYIGGSKLDCMQNSETNIFLLKMVLWRTDSGGGQVYIMIMVSV